jgi:quinoprotein glucose dehydrogenase
MDTSNVARLQVAWEYHTGDSDQMTQIQVNPIIVNGILYGVSPKLKLFALEAATGREKWVFKPGLPAGSAGINACRGVTYFNGGEKDQRLFYGVGSFMYCIDALSGQPIYSFGDSGKLDLHNDLGAKAQDLYVAFNTPGVIYKDLIIVGARVSEEAAAAHGHIRAYDVHTGKLRWIFHTIPQPGEPGYETWDDSLAYKHIGGANAWAGFTLDEKNGIVFAPLGSASYDFYGGKRWGSNLYANCVLALDAATGKHIWHYQTVHHDVWDRDLPTAPVLVTVTKGGKKIDAVAQPAKTGFIFLLNRKTGEPIYPIEEKPVPTANALPGEKLFPTQPMPGFPEPFTRQALTEDMLNHALPDSSFQDIKARFAAYKTGSMFTPPSKAGTIIFPGTDGGAEWGGPAYDPTTNMLYINANEVPWVLTMVEVKKESPVAETNGLAGKRLFTNHCMGCHAADRKGGGNNPSLIGVQAKYKQADFLQLLANGRRLMPAFGHLSETEREAIASFILEDKQHQKKPFVPPVREEDAWHQLPYNSTGYHKFLSKEGYPAVAPPWGTLNAVDLNTGKIAWKQTLGDYPELKAKGIHSGTENYGGPAVTAGGLLFIAATADAKIRAFHKRSGKLLWEADLPACGFATPSVYAVDGRQYVVIACGGGKLNQPSGDAYVAFALPAKEK